jgi:transcriptional regulator with XRE-family HTH domain
MDNDSIKDNLYRLRKRLDMTQQQMADKIGISRNAYADLESGVTRILNEKIESVARLADVSVEELCLGYKPRTAAQDVSALSALKDKDDEIASLQALVSSQKETISSQRDSLRYQEQIILMLKRRLGEEIA